MSSLRSTKDLKNMVENSRKITFSNTYSGTFENDLEKNEDKIQQISEADETQHESDDDNETYNSRFEKKAQHGKLSFGAKKPKEKNDFKDKFYKQVELSQNDAVTIEQLQKKVCIQKIEIEELQKKFDKLVTIHNKLINDVQIERNEYSSNKEKYENYDSKL